MVDLADAASDAGGRNVELLSEYVNHKFTVLAGLTERPFSTQQGVLSTTVWAKFKAVQTMSASLQIPNVGWSQVYVLLATLPEGWIPAGPLDSFAMKNIA